MKIATSAALLLLLAAAAAPARAQEGRDHTHNPTRGTADPQVLLRMLAPLQESFRMSEGRYAATPEELRIPEMPAIRLRLSANGAEGYLAVAASATQECVLFHGAVSPPSGFPAQEDRITCRPVAAAPARSP